MCAIAFVAAPYMKVAPHAPPYQLAILAALALASALSAVSVLPRRRLLRGNEHVDSYGASGPSQPGT